MRDKILRDIAAILGKIPDNTGLTEDEVRLEVAIKIMEAFPRGVQGDVDIDLDNAVSLAQEASNYYSGTVHPEDFAHEPGAKVEVTEEFEAQAVPVPPFVGIPGSRTFARNAARRWCSMSDAIEA